MIVSHRIFGDASFAFSDRHGGASASPFDGLNLARHVGDVPAVVEDNRAQAAASLGLAAEDVVYMHQVHGADVAMVDGPWRDDSSPPAVDAMVTTRRGLALAVMVADCVPVVLADAAAGVVGVAHAGRPGLAAGMIHAVVDAMRDAGARSLVAEVGPAVCGACYEVPEEMRADVARVVPQAWSATRSGTPALDVPGGVTAQLSARGVQVTRHFRCTLEDASLYSYRRNRVTGRFAGFAWLSR